MNERSSTIMLNIYIGKDNLPRDKIFVYDPESVTSMIDLNKNDRARDIIQYLELGKVIDSSKFYDRFGIGMYTDAISTTAKILLLIDQTDYIINANELGLNGIKILEDYTDGNVYFNHNGRGLYPNSYPVRVNGSIVNDEYEYLIFGQE